MSKKADITRLTEAYLKERTELRRKGELINENYEYSMEYKKELKEKIREEAQEILSNYRMKVYEIVGTKRQEIEAIGLKMDQGSKEDQILKEMQLGNIYREIELSGKHINLKNIANRMEGLDPVSNKTIKAILKGQGIDPIDIEDSLPVDTEEATSKRLYNIENHVRRLSNGIDEKIDFVIETGLMGLEHTLDLLDEDLNYIA